MYQKYVKRLMDIIITGLSLLVLSPVFLMVAILVRIKLGSPVIFKQKRPGRSEKIFTMYKFRTMTDIRDENGELLPDDQRLTRFGKLLRSTSVDELPELWNILKGDMSLVGPRPLLVRDIEFMTKEQRRRQVVRQGLTGLAQVNGRNNISWEEKINLDLKYIETISLKNDFKIIILTIYKVFKREDINTKGMDTAEDYGDYLLRTKRVSTTEYQKKINISKEKEV